MANLNLSHSPKFIAMFGAEVNLALVGTAFAYITKEHMSRKNKRIKGTRSAQKQREKGPTKKAEWTKIGVLAGIFFGVAGVLTSILVQYWGLTFGGSLKSSDVSLQFEDDALKQDDPIQVFVGAGSNINVKDKVLIPVRLSLSNVGDTVLSNVRLALAYDKRAQITFDDVGKYFELHGALMPGDITSATNTSDSDGEVYTNFNLSKLNLKDTKSISYALQAYEVDSKSRRLIFGVTQLELDVLVEADGVPRKHFHIDYNVLPADGCDGLSGMYQRLYGKLGYSVLGHEAYTDYLICADFRKLDTSIGRYWFPLSGLHISKAIVRADEDSKKDG